MAGEPGYSDTHAGMNISTVQYVEERQDDGPYDAILLRDDLSGSGDCTLRKQAGTVCMGQMVS